MECSAGHSGNRQTTFGSTHQPTYCLPDTASTTLSTRQPEKECDLVAIKVTQKLARNNTLLQALAKNDVLQLQLFTICEQTTRCCEQVERSAGHSGNRQTTFGSTHQPTYCLADSASTTLSTRQAEKECDLVEIKVIRKLDSYTHTATSLGKVRCVSIAAF